MLVLTRKQNESIIINDNIEIEVLSVDGDQVKIGISAPSSVEVHRKEVYLSIKYENEQAVAESVSNNILSALKNIKNS